MKLLLSFFFVRYKIEWNVSESTASATDIMSITVSARGIGALGMIVSYKQTLLVRATTAAGTSLFFSASHSSKHLRRPTSLSNTTAVFVGGGGAGGVLRRPSLLS